MLNFKGDASSGTVYVIGLMILLIVFGVALISGATPSNEPTLNGVPVTPVFQNTGSSKDSLQLNTFKFITPVPTNPPTSSGGKRVYTYIPHPIGGPPGAGCRPDQLATPGCGACPDQTTYACPGHTCGLPFVDPVTGTSYCTGYGSPGTNCVRACVGKPVIYLYPVIPTVVNVKLTIPGRIVESDPLYPSDGWVNVLAHPGGSLTYQDKIYNELYYESQVDKVRQPDNGIVIPIIVLKDKLTEITTKLGLLPNEQNEFLSYWLPKLEKLKSPYVQISLIDSKEKQRIDKVIITPTPKTELEYLFYFKPQRDQKGNLKPLILPQNPPQRIGFTSVEWGGTIDY